MVCKVVEVLDVCVRVRVLLRVVCVRVVRVLVVLVVVVLLLAMLVVLLAIALVLVLMLVVMLVLPLVLVLVPVLVTQVLVVVVVVVLPVLGVPIEDNRHVASTELGVPVNAAVDPPNVNMSWQAKAPRTTQSVYLILLCTTPGESEAKSILFLR